MQFEIITGPGIYVLKLKAAPIKLSSTVHKGFSVIHKYFSRVKKLILRELSYEKFALLKSAMTVHSFCILLFSLRLLVLITYQRDALIHVYDSHKNINYNIILLVLQNECCICTLTLFIFSTFVFQHILLLSVNLLLFSIHRI